MNFKDQVALDNDKVFLNLEEFTTEHNLNGRVIKCVVDEEKFQNKILKRESNLEGVYKKGVTIFVSDSFLKYTPHPNELFKLDDENYTVLSSKYDMGIHEIDLVIYEEV